jgi:hypothetical protein
MQARTDIIFQVLKGFFSRKRDVKTIELSNISLPATLSAYGAAERPRLCRSDYTPGKRKMAMPFNSQNQLDAV